MSCQALPPYHQERQLPNVKWIVRRVRIDRSFGDGEREKVSLRKVPNRLTSVGMARPSSVSDPEDVVEVQPHTG